MSGVRVRRPFRISRAALRPEDAEHLVDGLRYRFGLGQAYHLSVHENEVGDWEIDDGLGAHSVTHPMSGRCFKRWFYERYGDVIVERRQTTEA